MSIPGSASPLFFQQAAATGAGYQVERSLRFSASDGARLTRTPSTAGNTNTYTISFWMKLGRVYGGYKELFSAAASSSDYARLYKSSNHKLTLQITRSSTSFSIASKRVLRDPSAWYHVVVSSQSGAQKLYINNVEEGHASDTGTTQFNAVVGHSIGGVASFFGEGNKFDGYLAEFHFLDGTTLAPTSFGEYDSNGNWNPKDCQSSLTYGTNGFYLKFNNNASTTTISQDSSGNNNHWTAANISVSPGAGNDSLIDTPTNYVAGSGNNGGNYATLNSVDGDPSGLSNGSLDAAEANAYPTIIPGSGQWYYEVDGTGYTWDGTRSNFTPRAGSHNFGQRPFSGTPNAGHVSVCTTNLPDPTIANGSTFMNATKYTGNGTTKTITGLNYEPDLVWIKNRQTNDEHKLTDSARGVTKKIASNSNDAEDTNTNGLTAFNSDGFTVGNGSQYNSNGETYIAWSWAESVTAGFSIVTYSGATNAQTISHGLNAKPYLIVIKRRDSQGSWAVYSEPTGATNFLRLNTVIASSDNDAYWNDTEPTNTVFTVNSNSTVNDPEGTYVAYCWAPVEGYSSIGSYSGGSTSSGPFVYTGFTPRWIMIKRITFEADWLIFDSQREGYNVDNDSLMASQSDAESTRDYVDILSNGFKVRRGSIDINSNGSTYLYAAFAERPFKTARAR